MQWRVYYLYSERLKKYYIGKTNDILRRMAEHNGGEEIFTRFGVPWKLVGYVDCKDNRESVRIEHKLKRAKNKKYIQWFLKNFGRIIIEEL